MGYGCSRIKTKLVTWIRSRIIKNPDPDLDPSVLQKIVWIIHKKNSLQLNICGPGTQIKLDYHVKIGQKEFILN